MSVIVVNLIVQINKGEELTFMVIIKIDGICVPMTEVIVFTMRPMNLTIQMKVTFMIITRGFYIQETMTITMIETLVIQTLVIIRIIFKIIDIIEVAQNTTMVADSKAENFQTIEDLIFFIHLCMNTTM